MNRFLFIFAFLTCANALRAVWFQRLFRKPVKEVYQSPEQQWDILKQVNKNKLTHYKAANDEVQTEQSELKIAQALEIEFYNRGEAERCQNFDELIDLAKSYTGEEDVKSFVRRTVQEKLHQVPSPRVHEVHRPVSPRDAHLPQTSVEMVALSSRSPEPQPTVALERDRLAVIKARMVDEFPDADRATLYNLAEHLQFTDAFRDPSSIAFQNELERLESVLAPAPTLPPARVATEMRRLASSPKPSVHGDIDPTSFSPDTFLLPSNTPDIVRHTENRVIELEQKASFPVTQEYIDKAFALLGKDCNLESSKPKEGAIPLIVGEAQRVVENGSLELQQSFASVSGLTYADADIQILEWHMNFFRRFLEEGTAPDHNHMCFISSVLQQLAGFQASLDKITLTEAMMSPGREHAGERRSARSDALSSQLNDHLVECRRIYDAAISAELLPEATHGYQLVTPTPELVAFIMAQVGHRDNPIAFHIFHRHINEEDERTLEKNIVMRFNVEAEGEQLNYYICGGATGRFHTSHWVPMFPKGTIDIENKELLESKYVHMAEVDDSVDDRRRSDGHTVDEALGMPECAAWYLDDNTIARQRLGDYADEFQAVLVESRQMGAFQTAFFSGDEAACMSIATKVAVDKYFEKETETIEGVLGGSAGAFKAKLDIDTQGLQVQFLTACQNHSLQTLLQSHM